MLPKGGSGAPLLCFIELSLSSPWTFCSLLNAQHDIYQKKAHNIWYSLGNILINTLEKEIL